jgi:hypothetical protein
MAPAPNYEHQRMVDALIEYLGGFVASDALAVRLRRSTGVRPVLIVEDKLTPGRPTEI